EAEAEERVEGSAPASRPEPACEGGAPLDALALGDHLTCWLRGGRATCAGLVSDDARRWTSSATDLAHLVAFGRNWCVAGEGASELRCFGEEMGELTMWEEERIERACGEDFDCVDQRMEARMDALSADGRAFPAGGAIVDVAATDGALCTLARGGRVRCWEVYADSPRPFRDLRVRGANQLHFGPGSVCALARGQAHCWDETFEGTARPTPVPGVEGATRLALVEDFGCAFDEQGAARCWGLLPSESEREEEPEVDPEVARPFPALNGARALVPLGGAELGACWANGAGTVRCWGESRAGRLGVPHGEVPFDAAAPLLEGAVHLASGPEHGCAADAEGALHCWGRADLGALGEARRRRDFAPVRVPGLRATALALDAHRSCARDADGDWSCWGRLGFRDARGAPWGRVPRGPDRPTLLGSTDCVEREGAVHCESASGDARHPGRAVGPCLVEGEEVRCRADLRSPFLTPPNAPPPERVAAVSRTLAVAGGGSLVVYEVRSSGLRERIRIAEPTPRALSVSSLQVCVSDAETTRCGRTYGRGELEPIAAPAAVQLVSGLSHHCGRSADGRVHCWGRSDEGQLGVAEAARGAVAEVPLPGPAVELAAGSGHTCARLRDGSVHCWGQDHFGQLGARPAWWVDGPVCVPTDEGDGSE
ncbi:MAG TPA: hypothetical protein RMH80_04140, partial [Polyangiaceae bacterium LLY-WYZ-15_(1-7)]|nr:hypothetical protein [Polyangiaceae bacterium LLY-WYZ-15_(1-7)]